MLNSQESQDNLYSSFPTYTQSSLGNEDPSFLVPRNELFAEAGLLGISAAKNIPQLTQMWMNERNSPELLPYERALVEPLIEAIEDQVRRKKDKNKKRESLMNDRLNLLWNKSKINLLV